MHLGTCSKSVTRTHTHSRVGWWGADWTGLSLRAGPSSGPLPTHALRT